MPLLFLEFLPKFLLNAATTEENISQRFVLRGLSRSSKDREVMGVLFVNGMKQKRSKGIGENESKGLL